MVPARLRKTKTVPLSGCSRSTRRHTAARPSSLAEIDGLRRQQDTRLRAELEHQGVSKKAAPRPAAGAVTRGSDPQSCSIGCCSSISMAEVGRAQTGVTGTSTKPGAAVDVEAASAA